MSSSWYLASISAAILRSRSGTAFRPRRLTSLMMRSTFCVVCREWLRSPRLRLRPIRELKVAREEEAPDSEEVHVVVVVVLVVAVVVVEVEVLRWRDSSEWLFPLTSPCSPCCPLCWDGSPPVTPLRDTEGLGAAGLDTEEARVEFALGNAGGLGVDLGKVLEDRPPEDFRPTGGGPDEATLVWVFPCSEEEDTVTPEPVDLAGVAPTSCEDAGLEVSGPALEIWVESGLCTLCSCCSVTGEEEEEDGDGAEVAPFPLTAACRILLFSSRTILSRSSRHCRSFPWRSRSYTSNIPVATRMERPGASRAKSANGRDSSSTGLTPQRAHASSERGLHVAAALRHRGVEVVEVQVQLGSRSRLLGLRTALLLGGRRAALRGRLLRGHGGGGGCPVCGDRCWHRGHRRHRRGVAGAGLTAAGGRGQEAGVPVRLILGGLHAVALVRLAGDVVGRAGAGGVVFALVANFGRVDHDGGVLQSMATAAAVVVQVQVQAQVQVQVIIARRVPSGSLHNTGFQDQWG
ncbi:LOW QUALITY PROTEIN: hypothetical protein CRUP_004587 [Coryphaenoides rupestris]|nr:LOW QUALITY PROTEIN: hypothetical protein CRUP_004587 [Coryphaenoides rupestris]